MQSIDSQSQSIFTQKADSLFSEKEYLEASILYEELLEKHDINRRHTFLKLAYIHEQSGEFSRAIYYLSAYYKLNPTDVIFDRIYKMADENSFSGYGQSDLNFFLLLFIQYFNWIILILLIIPTYSFYVLLRKRNQEQPISRQHKVGLLLFILVGLCVVFLPNGYNYGIVNKNSINLRSAPSSAAEISNSLKEGSRVNIVGQEDIWLKIFLNREIQYARNSDFWIIEEE